MDLKRTLEFCETESRWLVETTTALARLESPTSDKAAVDRCGGELARRLRAIGATVDRIPQSLFGDHICARVGRGPSQFMMLGHFDTVWPIGQT